MSHTVKIQTKFTQLDALKKAFESLGWKIVENQSMHSYPGDREAEKTWPLVAKNAQKSGYDLGLKVNAKTGEIEVYGDFYGGSIAASLGNDLAELKKQYAVKVIEEEYAWEGYNVTVNKLPNGQLEVMVEK